MESQIYFSERPTVAGWGDKRIVPLNINEETTIAEDGTPVNGYRADLVPKVEQPLTVGNIVAAAIASEYSKGELSRIQANIDDDENADVKKYKAFVARIKAAAIKEGYAE